MKHKETYRLTLSLSKCPQIFSPKMMHLKPVQFSSVAQSCPTLCDPMNHTTPGLPVHHQLPEFTQTHVHQVSDAFQLSHPLSSPSPLPQSLPASESAEHSSNYIACRIIALFIYRGIFA